MTHSVASPGVGTATTGTIEDELLRICADTLHRTDLDPADDLFDRGLTSLAFIRILVQANKRFGVSLTGAELGGTASVQELAACVQAAQKGQ